jgi:hypothetical protein
MGPRQTVWPICLCGGGVAPGRHGWRNLPKGNAHVAERHRRAGRLLGVHSMTSSACASSLSGMVSPSAIIIRIATQRKVPGCKAYIHSLEQGSNSGVRLERSRRAQGLLLEEPGPVALRNNRSGCSFIHCICAHGCRIVSTGYSGSWNNNEPNSRTASVEELR